MSERSETLRSTQLSLEEKRSQCAEAELRSNKVEEHYLNVTQKSHDRQINEYKVTQHLNDYFVVMLSLLSRVGKRILVIQRLRALVLKYNMR